MSKYSIHFGVENYPRTILQKDRPLRVAHEDAESLATFAKRNGYQAKAYCDSDATSDRLQQWLLDHRSADRLFVTFSGHGILADVFDPDQPAGNLEGGWMLHDRYVPDYQLRSFFEPVHRGALALLVSDCCYAATILGKPGDGDDPWLLASVASRGFDAGLRAGSDPDAVTSPGLEGSVRAQVASRVDLLGGAHATAHRLVARGVQASEYLGPGPVDRRPTEVSAHVVHWAASPATEVAYEDARHGLLSGAILDVQPTLSFVPAFEKISDKVIKSAKDAGVTQEPRHGHDPGVGDRGRGYPDEPFL